MKANIVTFRPEHGADAGRICFEAFGALQDRHGVERDFDTVETAGTVVGMIAARSDVAGFAALDGGRVVGSNFLWFSDAVAGVGPITIRPDAQSSGIGQKLMLAVMEEAGRRGIRQVRLLQEAINTASLSLYTKLGFDWREAVTLMRIRPAAEADPRVRPATASDLGDIERISSRHYHASRRNEAAWMLANGMPGFVIRGSGGSISGYCFPGFLGHGFADSAEDLATLVVQGARQAPPPFLKGLVPLGELELHRALLARGCRSIKLFNYMTTGPYTRPRSAWMPCIGM